MAAEEGRRGEEGGKERGSEGEGRGDGERRAAWLPGCLADWLAGLLSLAYCFALLLACPLATSAAWLLACLTA